MGDGDQIFLVLRSYAEDQTDQPVFFVLNATHRFGASYPLGVLVGAVVHLLILGPALAHWRRMTWI
jgi:hypothetical protein